AGTTTAWFFADDFKGFGSIREYMVFHTPIPPGKNKLPHTPALVGKHKANDFGLQDIHGNVAEMCSDSWDLGYYARCAKEPLTIDPKGALPKGLGLRVVRGGSFLDLPQIGRSAYRSGIDPSLGYVGVGFRVVCEISVPE